MNILKWKLPANDAAAVGQTGAESQGHNQVTLLKKTFSYISFKAMGTEAEEVLAYSFHIHVEPFNRYLKPIRRRLNNSFVCLVGNYVFYIIHRDVGLFQEGRDEYRIRPNGEAVDLPAVHEVQRSS